MSQRAFTNKIPSLETPRLFLRELQIKDSRSYFQLCSNPSVMKAYGVAHHKNENETKKIIQFHKKQFQNKVAIRWGIFYKENNSLIGDVGYWRFDWNRNRGEMGAKLIPCFFQKGLMTEALRKLITFGFEKLRLHSIEGAAFPQNPASKKLLEKLGFRQEGYRKEFSYSPYEKKYLDSYLYSLLESDWKDM